jgi:ABC-type antimicrobial peptide transport system permease subunit
LNITITGFFQEGNLDLASEDDSVVSLTTLKVPWIVMSYDYVRAFDLNLTNKYDRTYLSEHLYLDMRHDVINYVFPEISGVQLNSITQEMSSNMESGVLEVYLLNAYTAYQSWIQIQRFYLILVSAPIMIMAILLLALVVNYAVSGKVTEINMMLARGALEGQIKKMIYRELLRIGAIGGLIGLGIGWIMGHIALSVKDFLLFDLSQILISPFNITLSTVIISWGITVIVVMFAGVSSNSMWRPGRVSAYPTDRKPPDLYDVEKTSEKESSPGIKKLVSGVKTTLRLINLKALAVALTAILFGLIWYITFVDPLPYLPDLYGYILGLFLITYLISRLGPPAFKFALERAPQSIQKKRSEYRSLNLMMRLIRRGEEAFGLVFFLSLTITFGFASAVTSATLHLSASDLSYYRVGADIQLTTNYANASLPQDFTSNLTGIPGVAAATPLKVVWGDVGTYTNVYLLGINVSEYNAISYASGGGSLKDSPERLSFEILEDADDTVIIGYDTLLATGKSLIDTINIGYNIEDEFGRPIQTEVVTMDIGAVVNSFAGFPLGLFVVMRLDVLMGLTNSTTVNHFLVDVDDGYNATLVAQDIEDSYFINFDQVEVADTLYKSIVDAELVNWLATTTTINFIYSSIFSGLFFGSYILSSFTNKKKDFTILRSIGLSRKQLITLSLIEIATFILPSIIFGTLFGAIYAYETNLNNLSSLAGGVVGRPRLEFTPFSLLLVTAVPVITALVTTLAVSWDYAKTNIPRILKLDMEMTRAYRLKA